MKNNITKLNKFLSFFRLFKMDLSFLFIFVIAFFLHEIKFYLLYILFLFLHEMSHFFVAKHYGYLPQKIHFNFFGASLEGYDDFFVKDEIKIILAGPAFNFLVIVFCYLSFWFNPESYEFFYNILFVNKLILIFNILPIFPLDAGRIILAILSLKLKRTDALKLTKNISFISIVLIVVCYIILFVLKLNFSFGFALFNLVFLFLDDAEGTSYKRELFVSVKFKNLNKGLTEKIFYVKYGIELYTLLKFIDFNHLSVFVFVDDKFNEVSRINEFELYHKLGIDLL